MASVPQVPDLHKRRIPPAYQPLTQVFNEISAMKGHESIKKQLSKQRAVVGTNTVRPLNTHHDSTQSSSLESSDTVWVPNSFDRNHIDHIDHTEHLPPPAPQLNGEHIEIRI